MLRRTTRRGWKIGGNMGVAPRYDSWNEKHEPWEHMRRMSRLVGTGFYIPPEWYSHFRMFPPTQHNYQQEKTLNPNNDPEPTQTQLEDKQDAERRNLRDELSRGSRTLASAGKRYYNIFWVQKPIDAMERRYYVLKRKGLAHDAAVKRALQEYYEGLAVKKRVQLIQAEEAKLSGNFITMREAVSVLKVLSRVQEERLAPHQYKQLATDTAASVRTGERMTATIKREAAEVTKTDADSSAAEAEKKSASPSAAAETAATAESLMDLLNSEEGTEGTKFTAESTSTAGDNSAKLRDQATDGTGKADWYSGFDPTAKAA